MKILQLVQIEVIFRNNVRFVTGHTNYCTKLFEITFFIYNRRPKQTEIGLSELILAFLEPNASHNFGR